MDNFRAALGRWLGRWHAQLVPVVPALQEYCKRSLSTSVVLAPSRMVDMAEEMLTLWVRNDTNSAPTTGFKLPVVIVAIARDMTPAGRDWGRAVSDETFITIDTDPQQRVFALRTLTQDVRCQLLFASHEPDAARALAGQFALWVQGYSKKKFTCDWQFAGITTEWPCQLETDDLLTSLVTSDVKNLTMLTIDVTIRVTEPFFRAPQEQQEFDSKGQTLPDGSNDPANPCGFGLVQAVRILEGVLAERDSDKATKDWTVT